MTPIFPGKRKSGRTWILAVSLGLALGPLGLAAAAADSDPNPHLHVILSREFFEAMNKLSQTGGTYGDRQDAWLEKIAVACQFSVKTNLTLIQQQERIIRLLEELARQRPAREATR